MSRFAVAHSCCFENDLTIEIIWADNLKAAILKHSAFNKPKSVPDYDKWFEDMPDNLEEIKDFFFDGDILVDAVKII